MRTKALLLAAAFAAAGVATSMAQVYSVNAVGYVNVALKPGFNLVSNPLTATDNKIKTLFNNIEGGVPDALQIYKFENNNFRTPVEMDRFDRVFLPEPEASLEVRPGEGVFVFNPTQADLKLTFVGEVPQSQNLSVTLPQGFSIRANIVPQAIAPDKIAPTSGPGVGGNIPGADGDSFFIYNSTTRSYKTYSFDRFENAWVSEVVTDPVGLPVIQPGQAFFYFRGGATATWTRSFNVNTGS